PGKTNLPAISIFCQSAPVTAPGSARPTMRSPSTSTSRRTTPEGVTTSPPAQFCLTPIGEPLLACYYANELTQFHPGVNMDRRTVCITGSTHGIGLGLARAFAAAGARLVLNSHRQDEHSEAAIAELSALTEVHFVKADLTRSGEAERLVEAAHSRWGTLDTLVNNAGTFADTTFGELTEDMFDRTFALNVRAYLFAGQAFANRVA